MNLSNLDYRYFKSIRPADEVLLDEVKYLYFDPDTTGLFVVQKGGSLAIGEFIPQEDAIVNIVMLD